MKKENRIKKNHEIASIVKLRKKVVNKSFVIYYTKSELDKSRNILGKNPVPYQ